jgi:hypothetical protein
VAPLDRGLVAEALDGDTVAAALEPTGASFSPGSGGSGR